MSDAAGGHNVDAPPEHCVEEPSARIGSKLKTLVSAALFHHKSWSSLWLLVGEGDVPSIVNFMTPSFLFRFFQGSKGYHSSPMHLNAPQQSLAQTSPVSNHRFTISPPTIPTPSTAVKSAADQQRKEQKPTASPVEPTTVALKVASWQVFQKELSVTLSCSRTNVLTRTRGWDNITLHNNLSWILRSSGTGLLTVQVFGPKPTGKLHSAEIVQGIGAACQRGSGLQRLLQEVQDLVRPSDLFCAGSHLNVDNHSGDGFLSLFLTAIFSPRFAAV